MIRKPGLVIPILAVAGLVLSAFPVEAQTGWQVRLRTLAVIPDEGGAADDGVTKIGGSTGADDSVIPELDISYFFTKNIAVELILGTTRHSMSVDNSTLGDVDLGEVSLLPPTLTVQYHPFRDQRFSPYVGAGLNYTIFFNADRGRGNSAVSVNKIEYDNNFGYALQLGMDIKIKDNWYFNVDLKKIFLSTDVNLNDGSVKVDGARLDPWIFGLGVGYRI